MSRVFLPSAFRCGARASNRLALAPLTNTQSHDDGTLSEEERRWLVRRAEGGFGIVTTCAAHVTADAKGFDGQLGVHDDACLPGLRALAQELAAHGAVGVVQLYHGGVRSPSRLTGVRPISASEFFEDRPDFQAPRAATEDDLARVIDGFVDAACRAERAGFGGVEIHGAHGYLLGQFLSRTMNRRDDRWGGDLEGRARLVRTVAQRIRGAVAPGFLVGVRLSPEDHGYARGLDLDDSLEVARGLSDDGVDYVHLSLWDIFKNTRKRPDEHPLRLFREAVPEAVRLVAAGDVWTLADAERALDLGADVVAVGRAGILNPDWPRALAEPGYEPARGPLSPAELEARAVSPRFVQYLRRFKNLVAEDAPSSTAE